MVHRQLEVDTLKCSRQVRVLWMAFPYGDGDESIVVYRVVISGLVYVVSPPEFLVVVEQDSHRVKAGLLQLSPTLPS